MNNKPLISICIPVLNEEKNIHSLYQRLCDLRNKMEDECNLEFIFTDNNSKDNTWFLLQEIGLKDKNLKAIQFSKNYGFQRSIFANFLHAKGNAIMQIDADLQDPPEMLEVFFKKWKDGYKVINGIRAKRNENILMRFFRRFGYWFINLLSDSEIPQNVGDFRLIDRSVLEQLKKSKNTNPYLRGMIAEFGFKTIGIEYARESRNFGKSKFSLKKIILLGLNGLFNHSTLPLRGASFVGGFILILSLLGAFYYLLLKVFSSDLPQGLASIHILVLFGIGLNAFLLGIIGEYLLKILLIIRADQIAIIQETVNLSEDEIHI